ncbi:MAG: putative Serine/Threonine kinase domain protein [Streblomastix strix]|uniref:non-specific serine/threonine protein kinase n=1 Tax=Streblomastix strix TaxID=222440 RepID=A0A5J4X3H1_9EUKA|nr:MAG: putative Serine/Threonine kinase domain protein [Streblomastix strix]
MQFFDQNLANLKKVLDSSEETYRNFQGNAKGQEGLKAIYEIKSSQLLMQRKLAQILISTDFSNAPVEQPFNHVIKRIAKGGYGQAYLVEERGTKNINVMKNFVEGFEYQNDTWYIIMEFCEGGDLDDFLEDLKKMGAEIDEDRAWDLLSQMIMAVDYLHQNRILHRDLKPKNVFLSSTFDVRLGDFGISRILADDEKYARTQIGSKAYMCPELIAQSKFNEQGDVWGIGITMYELLTGVLFTIVGANSEQQVLQNVVNNQEPEITSYYSEGLRNVVHKMLIKV